MANDTQTWVFPPSGAAQPPLAATSSFGPVRLGDTMILDWTPATSPEIVLSCFSSSGVYTGLLAAKGAKPPYEYKWTDSIKNANTAEKMFCHFWFRPSELGNTVVWEFSNQPRDKAMTFGTVSSSTTSKSTTTSTTSSSSSTSGLNQSSIPSPASTATPNSTGLTAGAKAGIAVGIALLILGMVGAVLFCLHKKRKRRTERILHAAPRDGVDLYKPYSEHYGHGGSTEFSALEKEAPTTRAYVAELEGDHGGKELDGTSSVGNDVSNNQYTSTQRLSS